MLESVWDSILDLTAQFVIPDWGALVGLIPIGLLVLVAAWLALTVRRFATAGPQRRGKTRLAPRPPPGTHPPVPSYAPFFAAFGTFLLLFGLVAGGIALPLGAVAFFGSLLYWGREGLADYDHLVRTERMPAVVAREPPPGVHIPAPSFRPFLASVGLAVLLLGLVFGGWILLVGIILLVVPLLGWLSDARAEYAGTVEADRTGHLQALPAPGWPTTLLLISGALFVGALILNLGILPPRGPAEGGTPGAPGASGGPGGSGGPPSQVAADLHLTAENVKFDTGELSIPAGKDFTIGFDNKDNGVPHDVAIRDASAIIFNGDDLTGPAKTVYQVPALKPGPYTFMCTFHSSMTGTLNVK